MSVREALQREIKALGVEPIAPGMVAAVLSLGDAMDNQDGATARANAVAQLRMVMADLRELAPVQSQGDTLDELTQRRKERHVG